MGKYKICVYSIAKNEERFARRWYESAKDADEIVVLDTGSTDRTVETMQELGVKVTQKIFDPFRFDKARNESLKLIPSDTDICICLDIDEILCDGWREKLENQWSKDTDRARYRYVWNYTQSGKEGYVFFADKVHTLKSFKWKNAVHEVLDFSGESCKTVTLKDFEIYHKADDTKSREQYLGLLELAVKEDPQNDRNMHYLGREYMFKKRYSDAIYTLKKHLDMPTALWKDERSASMIYIARSYMNMNQPAAAKSWLYKAISEAPHLREPLYETAAFLYSQNNWYGVIYFANEALKIKTRTESYITSPAAWGDYLYDILSVAYFHTGDTLLARENAQKAYEISKSKRIRENLSLFERLIK